MQFVKCMTMQLFKHIVTSDMQFGFKANHSTVMCSLVYLEVINHYVKNRSNVYSCLLDASKTFDKVHYGKLFKILQGKKFLFCIIRLLLDSYIDNKQGYFGPIVIQNILSWAMV